MKKLILYREVKDNPVRYTGKIVKVPDRAMTLKEILQRFTRKQSLPVQHPTFYKEETDVDLEKLSRADILEKHEYLQKYSSYVGRMKARFNQLEKEKEERAKGGKDPSPSPSPEKKE